MTLHQGEDGMVGVIRTECPSEYAQEIARLIADDHRKLSECINAIIRDGQRQSDIQRELNRLANEMDVIRKRVDGNVAWRDLATLHLPFRKRSLELLCADQGWEVPDLPDLSTPPAVGISAPPGLTPTFDQLRQETGPQNTITDHTWLEEDK